MEPYLYHAIKNYDLDRLINILKTGYILPRKMLGEKYRPNRGTKLDLNGESWISLCQKSLYDDTYADIYPSSFEMLVKDNLSVVISPDIEGINYPNFVSYDELGPSAIKSLIRDDSPTRYSTYLDEVQTNIPIPTSKFIAIGYPKEHLEELHERNTKEEIDAIRKVLDEENLSIPVIDSSSYEFADTEEKIKKLVIR